MGGLGSEDWVPSVPLLSPHQTELIAANLLWRLSDGLRLRSKGTAAAIRCLADLSPAAPMEPVGLIGHLAMVAALSAAQADKRIAAAEAWARWAADGRLDADRAVEAICLGDRESQLPMTVNGVLFPLSRVGEALGYAVAEPAAAAPTARFCLAAVAALLDEKPAGLHLLLEVAARSAAVSPLPELPAPVAALAAGKSASKLNEAARRLSRLAA
jgi:hypothetical protein